MQPYGPGGGGRRVLILFSLMLMGPAGQVWSEEPAGPTFRIFSHPNTSWKYDEELGTAHNPIWAAGAIVDGAFHSFKITEPVNKYGNYGEAIGGYLEADLKIALFGSSFTAPDTTNLFQERLAEKLGKTVHVLNFSIGSTGMLSMFDVARVKVPEFRPDVLLFTYNATAYIYPRIWRFNQRGGDHYWRFYQSLAPAPTLEADPKVADLHAATVITNLITPQWLERMNRAEEAGDETILREDPLVREFIREFERNEEHREKMIEQHGLVRISLLPDYSYLNDQRFLDAAEYVKASGLPFHLIHVPTRPELESKRVNDFVFPAVGVPEEQGRRHVEEVGQITGKEVVHLVDHYDPEKLKDPSKLVASEHDGHPGQDGIPAMADAFVKFMLEHLEGDID